MTFNLSSLSDVSCDSGVCIDTSAVPVSAPPPISSVKVSPLNVSDVMNLPSSGGPANPYVPTVDPNAGCIPQGFVGPLAPGEVYCPGPAPSAVAVTSLPWGTLAAVLGGVVLIAAMSRRSR